MQEAASVKWLKQQLKNKQNKNPQYSLRAFAQALDISSGRLSEYMNANRPITLEAGERICRQLNCPEEEKNKFFKYLEQESKQSQALRQFYRNGNLSPLKQLVADREFQFISNPLHLYILALTETASFQSDMRWIANRLKHEEKVVKKAIQNLLDLNFLEKDSKGKLKAKSSEGYRTNTDIPNHAIRNFHKQQLQNAMTALDEQNVLERDITSMVFAIDKSKLPEAKKLIQEFRYKMSEFLEDGVTNEVYSLNIQLVANSKEKISEI